MNTPGKHLVSSEGEGIRPYSHGSQSSEGIGRISRAHAAQVMDTYPFSDTASIGIQFETKIDRFGLDPVDIPADTSALPDIELSDVGEVSPEYTKEFLIQELHRIGNFCKMYRDLHYSDTEIFYLLKCEREKSEAYFLFLQRESSRFPSEVRSKLIQAYGGLIMLLDENILFYHSNESAPRGDET